MEYFWPLGLNLLCHGTNMIGAHPECSLIPYGIENSYLALVFAGRKVAETDLKAERRHPEPAQSSWCHGDGRRLKCLFPFVVETDIGNQR